MSYNTVAKISLNKLKNNALAVKKLLTKSGLFIVNLGTGTGYSVLDMVNAFSKAAFSAPPPAPPS